VSVEHRAIEQNGVEQKVRSHFHADARRFDAIYEDAKNPFARFVDNVWRGVVRQRFELTLKQLEPLAGKSLLDVGCGSGRYCIAYAERGARRVVGVDFAAGMIELANEYALRAGVTGCCEFRAGKFPEAVQDESFDACTAMGFFDYVAEPVPVISRMRELTRSRMIMSFPKSREWRAPVRRIRFWATGCPLFLYSESQVKRILSDAGVTQYDWIALDRDYIVVAHLSAVKGRL
jgi:2-polyprenyl-3-methyl-5-hydroxy-6-metoxy-1,4-benzoquinol methylase